MKAKLGSVIECVNRQKFNLESLGYSIKRKTNQVPIKRR